PEWKSHHGKGPVRMPSTATGRNALARQQTVRAIALSLATLSQILQRPCRILAVAAEETVGRQVAGPRDRRGSGTTEGMGRNKQGADRGTESRWMTQSTRRIPCGRQAASGRKFLIQTVELWLGRPIRGLPRSFAQARGVVKERGAVREVEKSKKIPTDSEESAGDAQENVLKRQNIIMAPALKISKFLKKLFKKFFRFLD